MFMVGVAAILGGGIWGFNRLITAIDEHMAAEHAANEEEFFQKDIARVEAGESYAIDFYDMDGSDDKLSRLPVINRRFAIFFQQCDVTDAGLESLANQPNLVGLTFHEVALHDAGLERVAELAQLEHLSIRRTLVTDSGFAPLLELPNLQTLRLEPGGDDNHPSLTAATVDTLVKFKGLKTLVLSHEWLDEESIARLREELPSCTIKIE